MSFLAKNPQLAASTAQESAQTSTYREADPVPLGYGRDYFASRWLCKPLLREHPAGKSQPAWKYASVAAQYCAGPIDYVGKVKMNGKVIQQLDYDFPAEEESHTFTLNAALALGEPWTMKVHRGTEDAPVPTTLNTATGQNHPPYRGRAWIEWTNIDLGQGTTALPDIQVEFGRRAPGVGGWSAPADVNNFGVNPFAAIHALLTEEAGFGLASELIDAGHWGAQALALEEVGVAERSGVQVYCHPTFKAAQEGGSMLSTILAHVDGYVTVADGRIRVGWFPSQPPSGALPEITEHDLEDAPSGSEFPDWNRAPGSVVVIYRDYLREYNETPVLLPAPANRETGPVSTPARVERPMIHVDEQAARIAAEIAAARGSNEVAVTLKVQKSRAVKSDGSPLMPGDLFVWDYGPHSLDLVMRVVGRRIRAGETADLIEAIPERGQFPLPYVAPIDGRMLPAPTTPGAIDPADVRLWLLPDAMSGLRAVAPLVNRSHRGIYRVDLHLSTTGSTGISPWSVVLDSRFFAAKCAIVGGIALGAGAVQVSSTSVDFARMAAQDAVAQVDDTLCLLLGDEVCSVGAISAVSPGIYELSILRGRRGTTPAAHTGGAVAFLFYRAEIAAAEHAEFYRVRDSGNAYHAPTATKYFKLQLHTIDEAGLAKPDDPGLAFQLPDLSPDERYGYTLKLTNEAHTVAAASDGTVNAGQLGVSSLAKTTVLVLRGATPLTAVGAAPNSDQFAIALGTQSGATGIKEDADTVYCNALASDTGTIEILVDVAGAVTLPLVFALTKSKSGATGSTGATGAQGVPGPGLVYMGAYNEATVYYHTSSRRDVVSVGSAYYVANNVDKNDTATWGAPGGGDWSAPDASYKFVATDLLLARDATILRTLVMGDGVTSSAGTIRSHSASAFGSGTGFWLGIDGATPKFRVGDPSPGSACLNWDGTTLQVNSPRIAGDGLYVSSSIGMRYIDDSGVLTITGGSNNGAGYGAQIDLCGAQQATGGALVLAAANNVSNPNGNIRFRTASTERGIVAYDGTLRWNNDIWVGLNRVLSARKLAVAAAPTDAPDDANEDITNLGGANTVHYANLVGHLNAVDARLNALARNINEIGERLNDLRDRLRVTGGHGLIGD